MDNVMLFMAVKMVIVGDSEFFYVYIIEILCNIWLEMYINIYWYEKS